MLKIEPAMALRMWAEEIKENGKKKRVFDNFDPHNNVVENIDLTYPVQNFARNSKMVRI